VSLYAADGFGYHQQVEAYFLSLSKIGVMLSSKDTVLMQTYRQSGVPVEIVCLGIRRAFAAFVEPPRSLYQCRHAVGQEIAAWKARAAGHHDLPAPPPDARPSLPGRDLPDPTSRRPRPRRAARACAPSPLPPPPAPLPPREPWLEAWHRSMERLIDLGKNSEDEHVTRCYRWAYKQMNALKEEALETEDREHAAAILPLAIGEVEAAMYDQLHNSLHPDMRAALEARLPPQMHRALRSMSPAAAHRQLRVWRRRLLEEVFGVAPFFVP